MIGSPTAAVSDQKSVPALKAARMFNWLFGSDPTKNFRRSIELPFVWNPERGSLNDIIIGQTLETIAPLGPATHHQSSGAGHHYLEYSDLGLTVAIIEGKIDNLTFAMATAERAGPGPALIPTTVRLRSHGLTVSPLTRERDVLTSLGAPMERHDDDGEVWLQYRTGEWFCEFDFDESGQLVEFTVYTD